MIAAPPLEPGALHDTVACPLPPVALTPVGAPGTVAGVTVLKGVELEPVPTEFVAVTVKL